MAQCASKKIGVKTIDTEEQPFLHVFAVTGKHIILSENWYQRLYNVYILYGECLL